MKIPMPPEVGAILKIISGSGYESFIVGGCVRDSLLGRAPQDWDITTNAKPETVVEIFEHKGYKVTLTGLKHGTVTLVKNREHYEVTTYRVDGLYEDSRRPGSVQFTSSIQEDLSRRDFTINAMAYNYIDGLIDCFNGYEDLQNKMVRCVGDPFSRFQEDALRMMRAIRFTAQLSFKLDPAAKDGISNNAYLLQNISKERIREEFSKIITADKPSSYIRDMISVGLMKYIIPEIYGCIGFEQHNPNHDKDVLNHILDVLDHTEGDLILRLSALFHDIGKPQTFTMDEKGIGHFYTHHLRSAHMAEVIMKRLRYDNKSIEQVAILVREHMSRYEKPRAAVLKKFINRVGIENLDRLFKLQIADIKGSAYRDNTSIIIRLKEAVEKVLNEKQPLSVKELEISGYDLMQLGISQGKRIGEILNELMEIVLDYPEFNEKEKLLELAREIQERTV
ncbi:CCA tRNA nucleotidyltransferase [Geosporobacter ferrireducens]|nr:CCA tRNA nucleotidyltransferase [Geosporobacter ferrireducens]